MKLVLAIVQDKDSSRLENKFNQEDIRATKLSTTGGFLKAGNTTFIVGVEDERVDDVLHIIKETCRSREQFVTAPTPVSLDASVDGHLPYPIEVQVGGATVFVLPVEGFHRY